MRYGPELACISARGMEGFCMTFDFLRAFNGTNALRSLYFRPLTRAPYPASNGQTRLGLHPETVLTAVFIIPAAKGAQEHSKHKRR
jgi:hypothetical protein